jgi:rhamnosyltransferase
VTSVSVAIPTLDGAAELDRTLAAVRRQSVAPAEIVVLDSSSTDGTRAVAARHGAAVHVIPRAEFGHGRARNRLMELTSGDRVAFLTQDAEPADERWLERLIAADAALACGAYVARPGASRSVRRDLRDWFAGMGGPRVFTAADLGDPPMPGPATFASSANLLLDRAAWARVPFRDVAYAEDQRLALDLLRAGHAKAWVPAAAVLHSHDYGPAAQLRRSFDEARALHEVYGWTVGASPRVIAGTVRAEVGKDRAFEPGGTAGSLGYHAARALGAALGTRADRLPASLRRLLSLEGRA